jgi:hypothetical protein
MAKALPPGLAIRAIVLLAFLVALSLFDYSKDPPHPRPQDADPQHMRHAHGADNEGGACLPVDRFVSKSNFMLLNALMKGTPASVTYRGNMAFDVDLLEGLIAEARILPRGVLSASWMQACMHAICLFCLIVLSLPVSAYLRLVPSVLRQARH